MTDSKPEVHPGDKGSAMPTPPKIVEGIVGIFTVGDTNGFSQRQYAAIHLKVPDSGMAWLDRMIEKSRLDDAAERFVATLTPGQADAIENERDRWNFAVDCYEHAAALRRYAENKGVYPQETDND